MKPGGTDYGEVPSEIDGAKVLAVETMDTEAFVHTSTRDGWIRGLLAGIPFVPCLACIFGPLAKKNSRERAERTQYILTEKAVILRADSYGTYCRCKSCFTAPVWQEIELRDIEDAVIFEEPAGGCVDPHSLFMIEITTKKRDRSMFLGSIKNAEAFRGKILAQRNLVNEMAEASLQMLLKPMGEEPAYVDGVPMTTIPAQVTMNPGTTPLSY